MVERLDLLIEDGISILISKCSTNNDVETLGLNSNLNNAQICINKFE